MPPHLSLSANQVHLATALSHHEPQVVVAVSNNSNSSVLSNKHKPSYGLCTNKQRSTTQHNTSMGQWWQSKQVWQGSNIEGKD